jgi:chondroitin 4-sulfotransferase 11
MIDHEHRAIFVHIQKTGGSSVSSAFGFRTHIEEKHFRADQLKALYGDEVWRTYFKFSFVRNPWDRLVSWWSMIDAKRAESDTGQRLNNFGDYILRTARTFEEFLLLATDEVADTDGEKSILRNQIDYLVDARDALMVDYVGRFEALADDFQTISQRVFGAPVALPHVNASAHAPYQRYYTDELAALVARRFARDIERFGYTFEGV